MSLLHILDTLISTYDIARELSCPALVILRILAGRADFLLTLSGLVLSITLLAVRLVDYFSFLSSFISFTHGSIFYFLF